MERRVAFLLLTLSVVVSCATGCTTDRVLVSSALAARHYHDGRYKRECAGSTTPACEQFRKLVNEALTETDLCNETQKIGKLPPAARKRLKDLKAQMEKIP